MFEAKTPFRPSSDDGSSCCSTTPGSVVQDEIPEPIPSMLMFQYLLFVLFKQIQNEIHLNRYFSQNQIHNLWIHMNQNRAVAQPKKV